jgi:hypothetical protein
MEKLDLTYIVQSLCRLYFDCHAKLLCDFGSSAHVSLSETSGAPAHCCRY